MNAVFNSNTKYFSISISILKLKTKSLAPTKKYTNLLTTVLDTVPMIPLGYDLVFFLENINKLLILI